MRGAAPRILAAAVLAALPSLAWATTYWVRPGGSDAWSGTDTVFTAPSTGPWATIAKANAVATAGDLVMLYPGPDENRPYTYGNAISPANSGSGIATAQRIRFVGDVQNPRRVRVAPFVLTKSYVTVLGVDAFAQSIGSTSNACGFTYPAKWDSIGFCRTSGVNFTGARYCVATASDVGPAGYSGNKIRFSCDEYSAGCTSTKWAANDTLTYCTGFLSVRQGTGASPGQEGPLRTYGCNVGYPTITDTCFVESLYVAHNAITVEKQVEALQDGGTPNWQPRFMRRCKFEDNRWTFTNYATTRQEAFLPRDFCRWNTFTRDSFYLAGPNPQYIVPASSGSWSGTVNANRWTACVFRRDLAAATGASVPLLYWQSGIANDTLDHCIVATDGASTGCIYINASVYGSTSVVSHCTLFGPPAAGILANSVSSGSWTGNLRVLDNIFYSNTQSQAAGYAGASYAVAQVKPKLHSNYNCYAYFAPVGDGSRSISGAGTYSRPGTGTSWNTATANDSNSVYKTPLFAVDADEDSSYALFSARLDGASPLSNVASDGTEIGARDIAADVSPPDTILDLTASAWGDNSITLLWTAPTQDLASGGACTSYDLRYQPGFFTQSSFLTSFKSRKWSGAIQATGEPPPASPGTEQSLTISGLAPGTVYTFMMTATDAAGNVSWYSNALPWKTSDTTTGEGGGSGKTGGGGGIEP